MCGWVKTSWNWVVNPRAQPRREENRPAPTFGMRSPKKGSQKKANHIVKISGKKLKLLTFKPRTYTLLKTKKDLVQF